jgi:hypothetical protein
MNSHQRRKLLFFQISKYQNPQTKNTVDGFSVELAINAREAAGL